MGRPLTAVAAERQLAEVESAQWQMTRSSANGREPPPPESAAEAEKK